MTAALAVIVPGDASTSGKYGPNTASRSDLLEPHDDDAGQKPDG